MTSLTEVYSLFLASSGVQTDSRRLTENQLFFALKGPSFDGNLYAEKVILAGAYAAVVDDPLVAAANESCYLVDDVLYTLQELAQHHRNQFKIPVVAIGGINLENIELLINEGVNCVALINNLFKGFI